MHICMHGYVEIHYICGSTYVEQRIMYLLELQLHTIVSYLIWVFLASFITRFQHQLIVFWSCLIYTWTSFLVSNLENVWTYILFSDLPFLSWKTVCDGILKCSPLGFKHQSIAYCKICLPFQKGVPLSHCCRWTLSTSVPSAVNYD